MNDLMIEGSETPTASPRLLTHRIDKRPMFRARSVVLATFLGLMVALSLIFLAAASPAAGWGILSIVMLIVLIGSVCVCIDRRIRLSIVLRSVTGRSAADLQAIVEEIVEVSGLDADFPPLGKLPAALVSVGRLGQTVQVGWEVGLESIEPFMVPFEPRLLNETDEAFDDLSRTAPSEDSTVDRPVDNLPANHHDRMVLRRIQRNLKLQGGWMMIVCCTVFMIHGVVESWERGSFTWLFLINLAAVLFLLFGRERMGSFSKEQWLIAPGGLLFRKAANRGRGVSLHIFDRRQCAMCVQQQHGGRWHVAVADAEMDETMTITDRERQLLLRAWLSPVAPPPLEQLVDLS